MSRIDALRIPCPCCGRPTLRLYPIPETWEEGCALCAKPSLTLLVAHFRHVRR